MTSELLSHAPAACVVTTLCCTNLESGAENTSEKSCGMLVGVGIRSGLLNGIKLSSLELFCDAVDSRDVGRTEFVESAFDEARFVCACNGPGGCDTPVPGRLALNGPATATCVAKLFPNDFFACGFTEGGAGPLPPAASDPDCVTSVVGALTSSTVVCVAPVKR